MASRIRQVANTKESATERYSTYKSVMDRFKESKKAGFHLESISLMESIIADRLESYLKRKTGNNKYAFSSLETLIRGLKEIQDAQMPIAEIEKWKNNRNLFLHEMAKIEDGKYEEFSTKYAKAERCAEDGKTLFRKLDAICRK